MLRLISSVTKGTPCRAKIKTHNSKPRLCQSVQKKAYRYEIYEKYLFEYSVPLIFQDDQCTASRFNKEI